VSNKRFESTVKIGDVVLVHNEGPRLEWKLAVIEKLIVSPDGEVRAAEIRTAGGKTNRPISKLYPLEVTETIEISSPPSQSASSDPVPATRPKRKAAIAANERIRNMAEEKKLPGREYVGNIISLPNLYCNVVTPPSFFATLSPP
jgi:hypothetical protein